MINTATPAGKDANQHMHQVQKRIQEELRGNLVGNSLTVVSLESIPGPRKVSRNGGLSPSFMPLRTPHAPREDVRQAERDDYVGWDEAASAADGPPRPRAWWAGARWRELVPPYFLPPRASARISRRTACWLPPVARRCCWPRRPSRRRRHPAAQTCAGGLQAGARRRQAGHAGKTRGSRDHGGQARRPCRHRSVCRRHGGRVEARSEARPSHAGRRLRRGDQGACQVGQGVQPVGPLRTDQRQLPRRRHLGLRHVDRPHGSAEGPGPSPAGTRSRPGWRRCRSSPLPM